MKQKTDNKAIDPNLRREHLIEGASAGPGEYEYHYPNEQITVVATSQQEADRKMLEVLKNRNVENK